MILLSFPLVQLILNFELKIKNMKEAENLATKDEFRELINLQKRLLAAQDERIKVLEETVKKQDLYIKSFDEQILQLKNKIKAHQSKLPPSIVSYGSRFY